MRRSHTTRVPPAHIVVAQAAHVLPGWRLGVAIGKATGRGTRKGTLALLENYAYCSSAQQSLM